MGIITDSTIINKIEENKIFKLLTIIESMKKIVINLCGVKSKGGITVINNYISQNKSNTLYVLYDNSDLDKYIKNFDNKFIDTKRIYHLFLNLP